MRLGVLLTLALTLAARPQPRPLHSEVLASNDLSWLERLCMDVPFAEREYADRGRYTAGVKGIRSAAYVRLGQIGTPDSLAAIARIEAAHRGQTTLPRAAVPDAWLFHPAPHMSDMRWRIASRVRLSQGVEVGAFIFDFYGPPALFVATAANERWSRPRLVLPNAQRFVEVKLTEIGRDRVRADFTAASRAGQNLTLVPLVPDAIEFSLSDIEKDSDADGWTDVEENWLEMNWRAADTDRDGSPDGSDSTPIFEKPQAPVNPTETVILRRALFAMFGLTGAPHALFVRDGSPRLQLDNLPGPVFYRDPHSGVRVSWKILSRSDAEARVEITDYEGPLAASGNEVVLRRIGDEWCVVRIRMLWIS
jgi:hypothetical protein